MTSMFVGISNSTIRTGTKRKHTLTNFVQPWTVFGVKTHFLIYFIDSISNTFKLFDIKILGAREAAERFPQNPWKQDPRNQTKRKTKNILGGHLQKVSRRSEYKSIKTATRGAASQFDLYSGDDTSRYSMYLPVFLNACIITPMLHDNFLWIVFWIDQDA